MKTLIQDFWKLHGGQLVRIAFILVMLNIVIIIIDNLKKHSKLKQTVARTFLFTLLKSLIIVIGIFQIGNQFESFQAISKAIILSSSLLIAVIGFAFQKSLEDLIAGMMISMFHPFEIGDRINLPEKDMSGYIENITIRHTVMRTFKNARLIIPNSIMNKEVLENANIVDKTSSGFVDFMISYDSDIEKAKRIIATAINKHKGVLDRRTEEEKKNRIPQTTVYVNLLTENAVNLRASIWTKTIDTNFDICSEVRQEVLKEFKKQGIEPPKTLIKTKTN